MFIRSEILNRVFAVAAWGLLAFIAFATLSPIQDRPTLPTSTTFEHVAAFAVLGALFCLGYARQIGFVCLVVGGSAAFLEMMQLFLPDRHARLQDLAEKLAGGCVGIGLGVVLIWLSTRQLRGGSQS